MVYTTYKNGDFGDGLLLLLPTLVYKPHEYHSNLRIINHSEIGDMFTNLAIVWGPHIVTGWWLSLPL